MKHINKVNYVDKAEEAIKNLIEYNPKKKKEEIILTTSKIRNILMMVTDLYNEAIRCKEEQLSSDIVSRIKYIKMRLVYEIGRDITSKEDLGIEKFANSAKLLEIIDSIGYSREDLILFCKYMEALVAYHKYYGGKDK